MITYNINTILEKICLHNGKPCLLDLILFFIFLVLAQGKKKDQLREKNITTAYRVATADYIEPGVAFTITCSADALGITKNLIVTKINQLTTRQTAFWNSYEPFVSAYLLGDKGFWIAKTPIGRKWTISSHKGQSSPTGSNRNVSIKWTLNDANCQDVGTYSCEVVFSTNDTKFRWEGTQNISYKAPIKIENIKVLHEQINNEYELTEDVTLSCIVTGPQDLEIAWLWAFAKDDIWEFMASAGLTYESTSLYNDGCDAYRHMCNMTVQIRESHDTSKFKCVAKYLEDQLKSKEIALYVQPKNTTVYLPREKVHLFAGAFSVVLLFTSLSFIFLRNYLRMERVVEAFELVPVPSMHNTKVKNNKRSEKRSTPSSKHQKPHFSSSSKKTRPRVY